METTSMGNAEISFLIDEVFANVDKRELVRDLHPEAQNNGYLLTCPKCTARQAFLADDSIYIKCHNTARPHPSISLWDYIKSKDQLETDIDVLYTLAKYANYRLPRLEHELHNKQIGKIRVHSNVLEAVADHLKKVFISPTGDEFRAHLEENGWTQKDFKRSDIGLLMREDNVRTSLINNGMPEKMADVIDIPIGDLFRGNEAGLLIYPYRDIVGKIKGFLVLDGSGGTRQVVLSDEDELSNLIGFSRSLSTNRVIVAQDPLDAALSSILGVKGVVAVGATKPNLSQLTAIVNAGIKHMYLVSNGTETGNQMIEKIMDLVNAKGLIMTSVLVLPEKGGSISGIIHKRGLNAFLQILAQSDSGSYWKAGRVLDKYDLDNEADLDAATEEIIRYLSTITNAYDIREFLNKISESDRISLVDLMDKELEFYLVNKVKSHIEEKALHLLAESADLINRGKKLDTDDLTQKIRELRYEKELDYHKRPGSFGDLLMNENAGSVIDDDRRSNFRLQRFKEIDAYLGGFKPGLYMIAASTGLGMTSLIMNLLLDTLQTDINICGVLFGCDDIKSNYVKRLNAIVGEDIKQGGWADSEGAATGSETDRSLKVLQNLDDSNRLKIFDITERSSYEMLEIELLKRANRRLIVTVDNLLNLHFANENFSNTHMFDDLVIKLKIFALKHQIPIVCSVNINTYYRGIDDLHDHVHSEEIAPVANSSNVLWVLTESKGEKSKNGNKLLRLNCVKNKYSGELEDRDLIFDPSTGFFSEA